jgi:alanyl-tRNA synthetase
VTPDNLRFDFPFDRALTDDEKRAIEAEVRGVVRDDRPVTVEFMPMARAIEKGADAFFDEKYGETVRTVRVEDYSFELCGGTHCRASGQIGGFVITGERSIGSGMRRIEALTGAGADTYLTGRLQLLDEVAALAGARSVEALPDRIRALSTKQRPAATTGAISANTVAERAEEIVPGVKLVAFAGDFGTIEALKAAAKEVRGLIGSGVIAMALEDDAPQLFITVSDDLVARGIAAGDLVRAAMPAIEGKGGGRPEMAQGRGTRREGLTDALAAVRDRLRSAEA